MQLTGNTILITGGATGIGLELARRLAADNKVLICGRRAQRLEEAAELVPGIETIVADVAHDESRKALYDWVASHFPETNILINNAGVQHRIDLTNPAEIAKAEEEVAINFLGPVHLSTLFLPLLRKHASAAIVNVTSGLAFAPLALMPVYCATKAALHSLTMSLRHQLRATNVRVFEVIPPLVTSELGASHRPAELNRIAMPASTAVDRIVEGLSNDEPEIAIGDAENSRAKREELFGVMNR